MELVTSRLLLRELTDADLDAVHGYAGDPAVTRFMDWGPNSPADTVALEELRQDAYDKGAYYHDEPNPNYALTEDEFLATLPPDGDANEFLLDDWRAAQERPEPTDPDSLLAAQPDSGTHSIIDMARGVSAEPDYNTVSPPTDEQTLEFFGTPTPTPDQVDEWTKDYPPIRDRWHGLYIVSYTDGRPERIHFAGFSGD